MSIRGKLYKAGLAGLSSLFAVAVCQASEAMPGEAMHSTQEKANLEKAVYCMNILENRSDLEPSCRIDTLRNKCFSENYIQHSPHVEDGREAVLKLFAGRYANTHQNASSSIIQTASEGDLVWILQHVKRSPEDRGAAVINIFSMKDSKFVEHWNVGQPVPEESKNDNTVY